VRWLITGSGGRLGTALIARLTADDAGLTGAEDDVILPLDRATLDVTDSAAVREAVSDFRPDVVVNAAAYSAGEPGSALVSPAANDGDKNAVNAVNVIGTDNNEDATQRAYRVNAVGPAVLALAVAATGGRLVHVSSDLVFAGDATGPYPVDAPTAPRSAYGRTKLAGELAVRELLPDDGYVVRTSWLYGGAGDEVVRRAVQLAVASPQGAGAEGASGAEGAPGADDADDGRLGSPTWVADLAEGLIALSRSSAPAGIYHCTNSGVTTRLGFARAVRAELGGEPDPTGPDPSNPPASAATHSVLSGEEWAAAGLPPLPDWRDALHRAFVIDGRSLQHR
jgi:dTDP-4-dehydrorhamnose reductase